MHSDSAFFIIFAEMKTLLIILYVLFVVRFWPYIIALPFAVVKADRYIVTGRDNDPEVVEMKENRKREIADRKEARKDKRKRFYGPLSFWCFFK